MASFIDLLLELLVGFVLRVAEAIGFVSLKLLQLLGFVGAAGGFFGFVVTASILALIAFFVLRFIFHSAGIMILLIIIIIVLVAAYGYFSLGGMEEITPNDTTEAISGSFNRILSGISNLLSK